VDVQRIPGDDIDVADALLSQAAGSGADFLAKGGTRGCANSCSAASPVQYFGR
jgi:hypothetical protein